MVSFFHEKNVGKMQLGENICLSSQMFAEEHKFTVEDSGGASMCIAPLLLKPIGKYLGTHESAVNSRRDTEISDQCHFLDIHSTF